MYIFAHVVYIPTYQIEKHNAEFLECKIVSTETTEYNVCMFGCNAIIINILIFANLLTVHLLSNSTKSSAIHLISDVSLSHQYNSRAHSHPGVF